MKPLISVVCPTYNRANIIANAIRSIVDQTFKEWELIIVDDGSQDGTKRIVESFAHPHIFYHRMEHTGFVSKVRNYGNNKARGEIVVVQDSDDTSFPDRLEEIWKVFENPKIDLIYHGMYQRFLDPYHNCITRTVRPALPYSKEKLLTHQYIPGQVAYRTKCVLETPYDERIRCCDDYQILLEFCLKGYNFHALDKNLYEYMDSADSINVSGEVDGSRKKDVEVILDILKTKYDISAVAGLIKSTIATGETISREIISKK